LKNVASEAEDRKNEAKKRSLHGVNEHFEPNFDDASASAVVFQRAVNRHQHGLIRTTDDGPTLFPWSNGSNG
jgi:hypothetical protein